LPCPVGFIDGLAWDPVNDTLWWSDDVNCTVTEIHKITGATLRTFNFGVLTGSIPGCPDGGVANCANSGLALGLDHTLFMGSDGCGIIYSADASPAAPAPPLFLSSFATVGGRDEDMECGPQFTKSDSSTVETLLSKDAFNNTFAVIEMAPEQCIAPPRDRTPPEVSCIETTNPHGKTVPPAGSTTSPGPKGGQNDDGYYQLLATDDIDPFVTDTGSGTIFGPFASGIKIKYTEDADATPIIKKIGSATDAVTWHIIGNGDPAVTAVDDAGNVGGPVLCLVPPPPK